MYVHDHDRADRVRSVPEHAEHSEHFGPTEHSARIRARGATRPIGAPPNPAQARALHSIGVGSSGSGGATIGVQRLVADISHGSTAATDAADSTDASTVRDVLRRPGRPLPVAVRLEMEARLGADFSDVRLHTDREAWRSAEDFGAAAYASGADIVIGRQGADKRTLAHELSHVLQQRSGPVAGTDHGDGVRLSDPSDRFERQAEADAACAMAGPADPIGSPEAAADAGTSNPAGPIAVQRQGDKYRRKEDTRRDHPTRSAGLRMLDRVARTAYGEESLGTPHLAVALTREDSVLSVAGNTGDKTLKPEKRDEVNQRFARLRDKTLDDPNWNPRTKKDVRKLRALWSGDYATDYADDPDLAAIATASQGDFDWEHSLVGMKGSGAQHGEMTVLDQRIKELEKRPREGAARQIINMGGVKKACLACQWAFEAANTYIGPELGFEVRWSGGHGQLFPNWVMPPFLIKYPAAADYVEQKMRDHMAEDPERDQGMLFQPVTTGHHKDKRMLKFKKPTIDLNANHNPEDSDSDWETY